MRIFIGLFIVISSVSIFGYWGFFSLLFVLPFIGWKNRREGPFFIQNYGTTDYNIAEELHNNYPKSTKSMEDLLIIIADKLYTNDSLTHNITIILEYLKKEQYNKELKSNKKILISFLNKFSLAFPNWKSEYKIIYKEINNH